MLEDALDDARRQRHDHREPEDGDPRRRGRRAHRAPRGGPQGAAPPAQGLPRRRPDHPGGARPAPGRQPAPLADRRHGRRQDHDRRAATLGRGFGFGGGRAATASASSSRPRRQGAAPDASPLRPRPRRTASAATPPRNRHGPPDHPAGRFDFAAAGQPASASQMSVALPLNVADERAVGVVPLADAPVDVPQAGGEVAVVAREYQANMSVPVPSTAMTEPSAAKRHDEPAAAAASRYIGAGRVGRSRTTAMPRAQDAGAVWARVEHRVPRAEGRVLSTTALLAVVAAPANSTA